MNPLLIYDVGMHNGDDTAYYLHRGFSVVAVEADPDLAAAGAERFAMAINEGRLTIVNKAISTQFGEADFWICNELRVWNSFDRASASRNGLSCHAVKVDTVPLRALFQEHGVPHYLKLDIEGHDHVGVTDISPENPPKYVSMEISSVDDFYLLRSKGYKRFKCVQQGCFKPVASPRLEWRMLLSRMVTRVKSIGPANAARKHWQRLRPRFARKSLVNVREWVFDPGSSGPFGEEAPGEWLSFEQVLHGWLSRQLGKELGYSLTAPGLESWFDLHACFSE